MKNYLPLIIAGSLVAIIMTSCSKSDSISNINKAEFGNINQFDSIMALSYSGGYSYFYYTSDGKTVLDSIYTAPYAYYYYFKYNKQGLPVSKTGGFIGNAYTKALKDTLIYLDNQTIEIINIQYNSNNTIISGKSIYTFDNGYITEKIDYLTYDGDGSQYYPKDTCLFSYNSSHQLISTVTSDGSIYSTETDYVYGINTFEDSSYTIDAITKKQILPPTGSLSTEKFQYAPTTPNPYYKQEWLKMWSNLLNRTLTPYIY